MSTFTMPAEEQCMCWHKANHFVALLFVDDFFFTSDSQFPAILLSNKSQLEVSWESLTEIMLGDFQKKEN